MPPACVAREYNSVSTFSMCVSCAMYLLHQYLSLEIAIVHAVMMVIHTTDEFLFPPLSKRRDATLVVLYSTYV